MLENPVFATSFGSVIAISIAIAILVATLLIGGISVVRLGFFSKREEDHVGPLAPSDKGFLDRQLKRLSGQSPELHEEDREYSENETEEEYQQKPEIGRPAA